MRVVITGGGGFLGRKLARAILERGKLTDAGGREHDVREVVLVDVVAPQGVDDARVQTVVGDLGDHALVSRVFASPVHSVFHLAAVVSGEAEQDFDLGWRVKDRKSVV